MAKKQESGQGIGIKIGRPLIGHSAQICNLLCAQMISFDHRDQLGCCLFNLPEGRSIRLCGKVAYVGDVALFLIQARVDIMECEEVDRQALIGSTNHHVSSIWALISWEVGSVIVDVVCHSWPSNHSVWIPLLHQEKRRKSIALDKP